MYTFKLFYHPIYTYGIDKNSKFPRERYELIKEKLEEEQNKEHPHQEAMSDHESQAHEHKDNRFDNPKTLGKYETGSKAALPVFKEFVENALFKEDFSEFNIIRNASWETYNWYT